MATILIGSKLPHGLVLKHPAKPTATVTLKGLNSAPRGVNGQPVVIAYATTEIDQDFWDAWYMAHNGPKPFAAIASGAIFIAKTEEAAKKIAKEQVKRKTGMEPMSQESKDIKPLNAKD